MATTYKNDEDNKLGHGDDLGVHPEHREAENQEWENRLNSPDATESGSAIAKRNRELAQIAQGESNPASKAPADESEKPKSPEGLHADETAAGMIGGSDDDGFFKPSEGSSSRTGVKDFFWGTRRRKQTTSGGATLALIIGGSLFGLILASGPAQLIQLSHVLEGSFSLSDHQASLRLNSLFRDARAANTGDIGETRVGILGSKIFGSTISQLSDVGVNFNRSGLTGSVNSVTIDPDKLASQYPELDSMTKGSSEQTGWLAEQLGLNENDLSFSSSTGQYAIDTSDFGIGATRALAGNTLGLLDNGAITQALQLRILGKFFNVPSLFHPLSRAKASLENKAADAAEQQSEENDRVTEDITDPAAEATDLSGSTGIAERLSGELKDSGIAGLAGSILLFTAGVCTVRSVAGDVVLYNRAAIAIPAALEATDMIAIGEQVETGQDVDSAELAPIVNNLTDSQGQSVWDGKALEVTEGTPNPTGPDLPVDYQQGFSNDTTAQNIDNGLGLGTLGALACSLPGKLFQGLAGVVLAVTGYFDGGGSWAGYAAIKGAEVGATVGVAYFLQDELTNLLKSSAVIPTVLSGPLGGNILAYGAREAANISSIASGGTALSSTTTSAITTAEQEQSEQQFRSESFFARVFDIDDYRSLLGRLADTINPKVGQNVASVVGFIGNIGNLIPHLLASIIPSAHADAATTADDAAYNWGFPQYGIPPGLLTGDPYTNAGNAASVLDREIAPKYDGPDYILEAQNCFGVSLSDDSNVWDATPTTSVDPNSSSYNTPWTCSDTSDPNWDSIMLFIFDTRTMEAAACYASYDPACQELGYDN